LGGIIDQRSVVAGSRLVKILMEVHRGSTGSFFQAQIQEFHDVGRSRSPLRESLSEFVEIRVIRF
jgi:hypothetical protein